MRELVRVGREHSPKACSLSLLESHKQEMRGIFQKARAVRTDMKPPSMAQCSNYETVVIAIDRFQPGFFPICRRKKSKYTDFNYYYFS